MELTRQAALHAPRLLHPPCVYHSTTTSPAHALECLALTCTYECMTTASFMCAVSLFTQWRHEYGDLEAMYVGPLGGLDRTSRCDHCNAPLFRDECGTKCCVGRFVGEDGKPAAEWYGPMINYPFIARPSGEYGKLWYGNNENSKHFLANTRLYNCRYAFSSLQVHGILALYAYS